MAAWINQRVSWRLLLNLAKQLLFFYLCFQLSRLVFILYYAGKIFPNGFWAVMATFSHGKNLDISAAAYCGIFTMLLQFIFYFREFRWVLWAERVYVSVFILLNSLILIGDLGLYSEWGTKLSMRALQMAMYPKEAAVSAESSPLFLLVTIFILVSAVSFFMYWKIFRTKNGTGQGWYAYMKGFRLKQQVFSMLPVAAFWIPLQVLLIRGPNDIPLNESSAYWSPVPVLNHASVNTAWTLVHGILENGSSLTENPYNYFEPEKAKEMVRNLYGQKSDSTVSVLTTKKPNVVFIVIESFTADIFTDLGGDTGITPNLHAIINEGILFTDFYSSGCRTDQMLTTVLSGFPAQPTTSIIKLPDKFEHLPSLGKVFKDAGYNTSFYYGGDLGFGNFKAYLEFNQFGRITGEEDFPEDNMRGKWGAWDELVLKKMLSEHRNASEPFFSTILTLTSHEPFDIPIDSKFPGKDLPNKFRSSCFYTDQSIGKFFALAKKQNWYPNTLFVILADHGHHLPLNREYAEAAKYRIPCILYGDVLREEFKGKKISTTGNQNDLPATILAQLGISSGEFVWSKNLFDPGILPFAFYTFDDGFGWIVNGKRFVFDNKGKQLIEWNGVKKENGNDPQLENGKAFMQQVEQDYMEK